MRSTYSIDGETPTVLDFPSWQLSSNQYACQFYDSGPLSNSKHTITVTNNGTLFYLDYFEVITPDSVGSLWPSAGSTPTAGGGGITSVSNIPQDTAPTSTPRETISHPASIPLETTGPVQGPSDKRHGWTSGLIAGIVLACVIPSVLVVAALIQCRRRKERQIGGIDPFS